MLRETSYGVLKRYRFIEEVIMKMLDNRVSLRVLDFGCGSGESLTIPLARAFEKKVTLYAFDIDIASIAYLQKRCTTLGLKNLVATSELEILERDRFDLIIASEVIEHVDEPLTFLRSLRSLICPNGKMALTMPNGYGYFEIDSLFFNILSLLGVIRALRKVKRALLTRSTLKENKPGDTLALSPHLNFFTYGHINNLFSNADLNVEKYEGRVFMCGPLFSRFIDNSNKLLVLNNYLGSRLPPSLVSGWMVVVAPTSGGRHAEISQRLLTRLYTRFKRYINLKWARSGI